MQRVDDICQKRIQQEVTSMTDINKLGVSIRCLSRKYIT